MNVDMDKSTTENMENTENIQNGVNASTNSATSTTTAGKNPKGEGKYVSQIKKNFSNQSKPSEAPKPPVKPKTPAASVVSRLTAPTISSTNKSVKEDNSKTITPEKPAGKPTVNGKNNPHKNSKENIAIKKAPPEKGGTKVTDIGSDGRKSVARKNSDNDADIKAAATKSESCVSDPKTTSDPKSSADTYKKSPTTDSYKKLPTTDPFKAENSAVKEHPAAEVNTEDSSSLSLLEKRLKKKQLKLEQEAAEETRRGSGDSTDGLRASTVEPSLRERFGLLNLSQGQTDSAMATAEPQLEQTDQPQRTEYVHVGPHKIKCIDTDLPVVSVKRNDGKSDVKVKVSGEVFDAHRSALLAGCNYFQEDMKENEVIELKDISPKALEAMLDYFYHGYVTLAPDSIESIIEGGRFFNIVWMLDISCDYLIQHHSIENYSEVFCLTEKYLLGDLRWDIFRFIGQNLPELSEQENFYDNLSLELLLEFLMENMYCEASEFFVLNLVVNWVKADRKNRQEHLLSLLRQIRFHIMELEELEAVPEEALQFPEIRDAVEDATNYFLNIMGQCLKKEYMYQQRGARPVVTVLSFNDDGNILVYRDPTRPGLFVEELGPTGLDTIAYQSMSQAKIGNFLYAAGGYDDNYCSVPRVFRFDPKYRSWTEVAPMNESRFSFALCNSDSQLFAVGGNNRVLVEEKEVDKTLSSVEVYNPQENVWTPLQAMPVKAFDLAAEFVNGYLYVTGGISSDPNDPVPLNTTWCLNTNGTDGWVQKQNMLNGRQAHSMAAFRNKLFVVGGYTTMEDGFTFMDQVKNEVYDLETGQWTEIAPTPEAYGHLFGYADFLCDKLFTIGGTSSNASLYLYDPDTDMWEEVDAIGPSVQKLAILNVAYPQS